MLGPHGMLGQELELCKSEKAWVCASVQSCGRALQRSSNCGIDNFLFGLCEILQGFPVRKQLLTVPSGCF